MKYNFKKIIATSLVCLCVFTIGASVAVAQNSGTSGSSPLPSYSNSGSSGSKSSGAPKTAPNFPTLENPLGVNSVSELTSQLVTIALQIGMVLAVLALIYSGFMFVMAQGNEDKVTKAKSMFFWTIVGIAVLFGSTMLAEIIKATVNSLK